MFLSRVLIEKKMYAEAIIEATKARENSNDNSEAVAHAIYALAKSDKQAEAKAMLEALKRREQYVTPYAIALGYNGFGQTDEAIEWLVKAFEQRDIKVVLLTVDPKWNNLRSDSRFQELMRRVRFSS